MLRRRAGTTLPSRRRKRPSPPPLFSLSLSLSPPGPAPRSQLTEPTKGAKRGGAWKATGSAESQGLLRRKPGAADASPRLACLASRRMPGRRLLSPRRLNRWRRRACAGRRVRRCDNSPGLFPPLSFSLSLSLAAAALGAPRLAS